MNEVKRQLDRKMGDTKNRVNNVMRNVEKQKRKGISKRRQYSSPFIAAIFTCIAIVALIVLIDPFQSKQTTSTPNLSPVVNEPSDEKDPIVAEDYSETLKKYFKADGTIAHFIGTGSEYASYKETTTWIGDNYVELLKDNGGGITQEIYKVTQDSIVLLSNQMVDNVYKKPTIAQVKKLQPIKTILVEPFESGLVFGENTMTTDVLLETPFGKFNTILIEYEDEDTTVQTYYAENNGVVAKMYKMGDGYEVTQYLESVSSPTIDLDTIKFSVYHTAKKQTMQYTAAQLPFLYPIISSEDHYVEYKPLASHNDLEFGVFRYNCDQEKCSLAFVQKHNEQYQPSFISWGTYDHLVYSPDYRYFVIKVNATELDGENSIERSRLLLVDAESLEIIIPSKSIAYFNSTLYPIVEWYWLNNNTIKLTTADVASNKFEAIFNWQNSTNQKTKEIDVEIQ